MSEPRQEQATPRELACARVIVEELCARLWFYLTEYQGLVLVHIVRMRVEPEEPRGR